MIFIFSSLSFVHSDLFFCFVLFAIRFILLYMMMIGYTQTNAHKYKHTHTRSWSTPGNWYSSISWQVTLFFFSLVATKTRIGQWQYFFLFKIKIQVRWPVENFCPILYLLLDWLIWFDRKIFFLFTKINIKCSKFFFFLINIDIDNSWTTGKKYKNRMFKQSKCQKNLVGK